MSSKTSSFPYVKNALGMSLDDDSIQKISHSKMELYYHVMLKTVQMGSILGVTVGAGYGLIRRKSVVTSALNGGRNGVLVGLAVCLPLTYMTMKRHHDNPDNSESDIEYQYYDRAYRLRCNNGQLNVDRFAYIGEAAGLAGAITTGSGIIGGAAVGIAAGTLLGAVYNAASKKK